MRFIRGDSLQEAADRFHETQWQDKSNRALELRKLLGRLVDVCNAIAYAHSRGVLHRDLKPGNVMLGKYGETLVVDWGLAKVMGDAMKLDGETTLQPSFDSGSAPTQMGSAIGTPAYMPPEQAAGRLDELGPASDAYSLGATLYYLLTGRPPFVEKELRALMRKVEVGEFASPRSVDATIAKPLEAICLKAMATRPAERYESPQKLADDLERFLADEPVSALPEAPFQRLTRWMRRHKAIVQTAGASASLLFLALVIFLILLSSANKRLDEKNTQLTSTNQALTAANERERNANRHATKQTEIARARLRSVERAMYNARLGRAAFLWQHEPHMALQLLEDPKGCSTLPARLRLGPFASPFAPRTNQRRGSRKHAGQGHRNSLFGVFTRWHPTCNRREGWKNQDLGHERVSRTNDICGGRRRSVFSCFLARRENGHLGRKGRSQDLGSRHPDGG